MKREYRVIVIGGGHAGVEAAWAAANVLGGEATVALVTLDASKIGVMSCNPAIGGLAKGQLVREVDALGGLMGLATDATGIQFKVLNTSKGPAVHGPRAQCDKHAYADEVQRLIASRPEIEVIEGSVERLVVEGGSVHGVEVAMRVPHSTQSTSHSTHSSVGVPIGKSGCVLCAVRSVLSAPAVVLTTGTFMRGLMHTGQSQTPGGRFGEGAAVGISGALQSLGFELGRLKTGTPPRLRRSTIEWDALPPDLGDASPAPFSMLNEPIAGAAPWSPPQRQVECRVTSTCAASHELIRANLHRAPMYSGQIQSAGPRYCPSIEDKVVRFAERTSHQVYLEPESLRADGGHDEWIYCNGISTSLPADVQDEIVRAMPGCARAEVLRYGYAVEYDMVKPHQIWAKGETKRIAGLFLAGQINGTSGYEEAAGQGLVAGLNAARRALDREPITLGRDQAYIGVMMDDLATKTPTEPYRMFTSRAEHRLLLRSDNAADRLTPLAQQWGLLDHGEHAARRRAAWADRARALALLHAAIDSVRTDGVPLRDILRRPDFGAPDLTRELTSRGHPVEAWSKAVLHTAATDCFYAAYVERERAQINRRADLERRTIPVSIDYARLADLRTEARQALIKFRPATLGQAGRLEGLTPADVTLLAVLVRKHRAGAGTTQDQDEGVPA